MTRRAGLPAAAALVLLALVALVLGCGGGSDDEESTGTEAAVVSAEGLIEGQDGTFTLQLPDNWVAASDEEAAEIFESAGGQLDATLGPGAAERLEGKDFYFREGEGELAVNVNVVAEVLPEGADFEQAVEAGATLIEQSLSEAVIESGPEATTLDGEEAYELRYTAAAGEADLQFALIQALHEGIVYSITLTAPPESFDEAAAEFAAIIDTWSWT